MTTQEAKAVILTKYPDARTEAKGLHYVSIMAKSAARPGQKYGLLAGESTEDKAWIAAAKREMEKE